MKYPATFLNTLIATVIGTLGIIVIASMGGYKMARVKTRYSRFCFLFCIAPMMIPFQSFMLTLVNVATTLHINGKIWGLAIIYWGLGAPRLQPVSAFYPYYFSNAEILYCDGYDHQCNVDLE